MRKLEFENKIESFCYYFILIGDKEKANCRFLSILTLYLSDYIDIVIV